MHVDQISEMAAVMRKAIEVDEKQGCKEQERITQLEVSTKLQGTAFQGSTDPPGCSWSFCPCHSLLGCHPCLAGAGEAPLQLNLKEGMLQAHPGEQEGLKPDVFPWRRGHSTDFQSVLYSLCISLE